MHRPRPELDRLRAPLAEAADLILEKRRPAEGLDIVLEVQVRLDNLGVRSGYASWLAGVAFDGIQRPDKALPALEAALDLDPLDPAALRSRRIVLTRVRQTVIDTARPDSDVGIGEMYELLTARGEADLPCHLRMIAHLVAVGEQAEAERLAAAVAVIWPAATFELGHALLGHDGSASGPEPLVLGPAHAAGRN